MRIYAKTEREARLHRYAAQPVTGSAFSEGYPDIVSSMRDHTPHLGCVIEIRNKLYKRKDTYKVA